jgi:hypothetical protein
LDDPDDPLELDPLAAFELLCPIDKVPKPSLFLNFFLGATRRGAYDVWEFLQTLESEADRTESPYAAIIGEPFEEFLRAQVRGEDPSDYLLDNICLDPDGPLESVDWLHMTVEPLAPVVSLTRVEESLGDWLVRMRHDLEHPPVRVQRDETFTPKRVVCYNSWGADGSERWFDQFPVYVGGPAWFRSLRRKRSEDSELVYVKTDWDKRRDLAEAYYNKSPSKFAELNLTHKHWEKILKRPLLHPVEQSYIRGSIFNYPSNDCLIVALSEASTVPTEVIYYLLHHYCLRLQYKDGRMDLRAMGTFALLFDRRCVVQDASGYLITSFGAKNDHPDLVFRYEPGHVSFAGNAEVLIPPLDKILTLDGAEDWTFPSEGPDSGAQEVMLTVLERMVKQQATHEKELAKMSAEIREVRASLASQDVLVGQLAECQNKLDKASKQAAFAEDEYAMAMVDLERSSKLTKDMRAERDEALFGIEKVHKELAELQRRRDKELTAPSPPKVVSSPRLVELAPDLVEVTNSSSQSNDFGQRDSSPNIESPQLVSNLPELGTNGAAKVCEDHEEIALTVTPNPVEFIPGAVESELPATAATVIAPPVDPNLNKFTGIKLVGRELGDETLRQRIAEVLYDHNFRVKLGLPTLPPDRGGFTPVGGHRKGNGRSRKNNGRR